MALRHRRLGGAHNLAAGNHTIYTVPAGKCALLRTFTLTNDNGTEQTITPVLNGSGYIYLNRVAPNSTEVIPVGTVLNAGDSIRIDVSATACYGTLDGVEFDSTSAALGLQRVDLISLHTTGEKTWAVPAGKRFRVREVVIAPHDAPAGWMAYVRVIGVTLLYRHANGKLSEPVVLATDFMVEPGESIGASATQGAAPIHMFLSGVLEDA